MSGIPSLNTSTTQTSSTFSISSSTAGTIPTPTRAEFQDVWTFNFAPEHLIQHKLRLVKVNGQPFIAFSKFYLNPATQTYLPTKKHYFIPQSKWGQLQTGLFELSRAIDRLANGNSATVGSVGGGAATVGSVGGGVATGAGSATINTGSVGAGSVPTLYPSPVLQPAASNWLCSRSALKPSGSGADAPAAFIPARLNVPSAAYAGAAFNSTSSCSSSQAPGRVSFLKAFDEQYLQRAGEKRGRGRPAGSLSHHKKKATAETESASRFDAAATKDEETIREETRTAESACGNASAATSPEQC